MTKRNKVACQKSTPGQNYYVWLPLLTRKPS